jgi:pimeloyl-ACP methyl ester carboxylesterase
MKNIKFVFGILAFCWLPLTIFGQVGVTTDRNVTFLHGLNGGGTWDPFVNFFSQQAPNGRRMNISNVNFTSTGGFNTIANSVTGNFGTTSVAICHSMGGPIARRLDITGAAIIGGIITVGSPMDGAPVANSVVNGDAGRAIGDAVYALSRGPLASLGILNFDLQFYGNAIGSNLIPGLLGLILGPSVFGNDATTLNDLKVGGAGIEADKNAAPTNTPKISIWGNEDSPTHWNIMQTQSHLPTVALSGFPIQLTVPELATGFSYAYLAASIVCATIAIINWYNPVGWYNAYAAYQWYAGYDYIANDSERIYNNLIGSDMVVQQCFSYLSNNCHPPDTRYCEQNPGDWQRCPLTCDPVTINYCVQVHNNGISDAFIPAVSQRGEGSRSWRTGGGQVITTIEAMHMNHFEELQPQNVEMTSIFDDVFTGRYDAVFRINRR